MSADGRMQRFMSKKVLCQSLLSHHSYKLELAKSFNSIIWRQNMRKKRPLLDLINRGKFCFSCSRCEQQLRGDGHPNLYHHCQSDKGDCQFCQNQDKSKFLDQCVGRRS